MPAIEEAIFAGIPINVTLLFSREHYVAAAEAYLRGIERRIDAGLDPHVASVASVFISRWECGREHGARLAQQQARHRDRGAHLRGARELLASPRWQRMSNSVPGRSASLGEHGTKDPKASDILYVEGARRAVTVNTMPEKTLKPSPPTELGPIMARRRRVRERARAVRQGRRRCRRARAPAAGRRREVVRGVVERTHGGDHSKGAPMKPGAGRTSG